MTKTATSLSATASAAASSAAGSCFSAPSATNAASAHTTSAAALALATTAAPTPFASASRLIGATSRRAQTGGTRRDWLIIAGAGALALAGGAAWRLSTLPPADMGPATGAGASDALWNASLTDLNDKPYAFAQLRGKPLVINFWATWCGPCVEEMPDLQRFSQSELGKRAQMVGIGIDHSDKMRQFATKLGISYLLLNAGADGVSLVKALGNSTGALPFTLGVSSKGEIAMRHLGKVSLNDLSLKAEALLKA